VIDFEQAAKAAEIEAERVTREKELRLAQEQEAKRNRISKPSNVPAKSSGFERDVKKPTKVEAPVQEFKKYEFSNIF
jgi:hypothetical protein